MRNRVGGSLRDSEVSYFLAKWSKIFKDKCDVLLNKTRILLNKGQKLYKNLSQAVSLEPVSLHEILSDRDELGSIRELRRSAI